jgi:RNA polymerase sigma-70 factor (ECF subfamily)
MSGYPAGSTDGHRPRVPRRSVGGARHGGVRAPGREEDRELGRRFATGDIGAVGELYDRFAGSIYTVALSRLGGDRQLAEEAVQDVFVKAWRAAATFDPERPLSPWLYEIARHSAADIARREQRRPTTTRLSAAAPADEGPTLGDAWEAWEVRRALAELPTDELELVRLTHFLGLTRSEIAERLGLPIGTVKSRVHRAHRRLAERLAHLKAEP